NRTFAGARSAQALMNLSKSRQCGQPYQNTSATSILSAPPTVGCVGTSRTKCVPSLNCQSRSGSPTLARASLIGSFSGCSSTIVADSSSTCVGASSSSSAAAASSGPAGASSSVAVVSAGVAASPSTGACSPPQPASAR